MASRTNSGFRTILALLTFLVGTTNIGWAQQHLLPPTPTPASSTIKINSRNERIQLITGTSRTLELAVQIKELLPGDSQLIDVEPIGKRQVRVVAKLPGVTRIDLWDADGNEYNVELLITGDARKLKATLELLFPDASIRVTPLERAVVLWGDVTSSEQLDRIVRVASDYYPDVINNIQVGGSQTVLLEVKVIEVSRTKLRKIGFDMAFFQGDDGIAQNASGLISAIQLGGGVDPGYTGRIAISQITHPFAITNNADQYLGFLDALRQYNVAKIISEPVIVAESGRAASFGSGGEFPILIPQSLGTNSIEYREFGTRVDFVPIVKGNGYIRLEVYPEVSEIDAGRSVSLGETDVPTLRTRFANTAVTMKSGQTLAIAGLMQTRIEAINVGVPLLADMPIIGAAFRRVRYEENEIELLFMVTPHLVGAMEASQVPLAGPGMFTGVPNNRELYGYGYLEVPFCCLDGNCPNCESSYGDQTQLGLASAANGNLSGIAGTRRTPQLIGPDGYEEID
ncbi:MAG: pilus assembly protein N-terminal domain-containing protein [Pirellulaceae bacterium]